MGIPSRLQNRFLTSRAVTVSCGMACGRLGADNLPSCWNNRHFPVLPVAIGILGILIVISGLVIYRRKASRAGPDEQPDDPDNPESLLTEADLLSLEERVLQLLRANGGEQFQSEIVKVLGMPKSTVSSTLNDLHQKGIIRKVKKGRENLIRLVDDNQQSSTPASPE